MLCAEAGVPMLDYSAAFRSPYWTHSQLVEWTAGGLEGGAGAGSASEGGGGGERAPPLPMHRVLSVPVQALFLRRLKRCCALSFSRCKARGATCRVSDWRADADCCAAQPLPPAELRLAKANYTLSREQVRAAL